MQEILRHLFRGVRQRDAKIIYITESPAPLDIVPAEIVSPAPKPEIIDEKNHTLRFYPGFEEFAALWNKHAATPARLGVQQDILLAQFEANNVRNQRNLSEEDVDKLRAERERQRVYDARVDMPKKEKRRALNRATGKLRIARKKLERISRQEQEDVSTKAKTSFLVDLDNEFGLGLKDELVKFYALERLRGNQDALDSFLLRYSAKRVPSQLETQRSVLWRTNYGFFDLSRYYDDPKKEFNHKELGASADKATERQLGKARRSGSASSQ